jgi:hypothetical protein
MGRLVDHAKSELALIGYTDLGDKDDPNTWMYGCIIELLEKLSEQGHSGSSAPYCISTFSKLALGEPLSPLTGEDDEWEKAGPNLYYNNRCSRVFKEEDGTCYDNEGIVFRTKDGDAFINDESRVTITFPYTPVRRYIEVDTGAEAH